MPITRHLSPAFACPARELSEARIFNLVLDWPAYRLARAHDAVLTSSRMVVRLARRRGTIRLQHFGERCTARFSEFVRR